MSGSTDSWKEYEREIHDEVTSKFSSAAVSHDERLPGFLSGANRQIDILLTESIPGKLVRTAIEAKHYSRPIDVKGVESFIGLLRDVGVERGMMVSPKGYTRAGYEREFREDVDVDLDVFSLSEFKQWQAAGGIPYGGRTAVVMPAPIAWFLHAQPRPDVLAALYRRGDEFGSAMTRNEFMYVNIWDRRDPVCNLELLLDKQQRDMRQSFPDITVSVQDFGSREDARTCLRRAEIPTYPTAELTAFAEFRTGILFVVLFSPLFVERRNLRKLQCVIEQSIFMEVEHAG